MSNTTFNDQPHIVRLFRVLYMLQSVKHYKTAEIAEAVGVSARTVHRYIDEFRNSGFEIIVERQCFRLKSDSVRNKSIIEMMSGTSEWQIVNNVENLSEAIKLGRYVKLTGYASGHSRVVADRIVEPFELAKNNKYVWCFDPDAGYCKTFRPSRCQKVEILERSWEHADQFESEDIDIFGFHGTEPIHVVLKLDVLAHNLLLEENIEAAQEMTEADDGQWLLDTNVYDVQGIGRFCMGVLWHFEIVDAPELFEYLCAMCDLQPHPEFRL